ncbi:MAG: thiamine pyrophosphate-binding protein [Sphingobacteriia bacterium]|nr:thiamine pyrophosphate-binding protein [Sphingobacteriia bacterium]
MRSYDNVWDLYANSLKESGINTLFGMVGDGIGLLEATAKIIGFKTYTFRDQRVAIAAAIGFSQESNKCVFVSCNPGPGLANASMGILEAYSQCIPMIIISNGVSRSLKNTGAFQEFNSVGFMSAITKFAYRVESYDMIKPILQKACNIAINGKPGPVYIEIPDDLIFTNYEGHISLDTKKYVYSPIIQDIKTIAKILSDAQKPLLIAGGGCMISSAKEEFTSITEILSAAAFTTASGRGSINETHNQSCGLIGLYTSLPSKILLNTSDVIFFIGSQIEETVLIGIKSLLESKKIIQLNICPEDIGKSIKADYKLIGDAKETLKLLIQEFKLLNKSNNEDWLREIQKVKNKQKFYLTDNINFESNKVRFLFKLLKEKIPNGFTLVSDNGLNDMWPYFYPVHINGEHDKFFSPGEHTGLGLPIGVAVGVKISNKERIVISVTGDGSFSFGRAALFTAAEKKLGIIYIILNNKGFGWPALTQKSQNISIGCKFEKEDNLESLAKQLDAFYFSPSDLESLNKCIESALTNSLNNNISIIELQINVQDIPIGIKENYLGEEVRHEL